MFHLFRILLICAGTTSDDPLLVELRRLGVSSALVVSSQAIDEAPVWSPDGRYLAVNVEDRWSTVDTSTLRLREGTWHSGDAIAVAVPPPTLVALPESKAREWQTTTRSDPRRIATKSGVSLELAQEELGTAFRVTKDALLPDFLDT